ncbi:MAG: glycosyl transferase [Planctomycetaceae bacterium]|nr:glycosyl transferase [Planctomycetaceae bacterium]|tara:strand:+ start:829 stop:1986 length:1158 start_codon:yes stop_codon:yes gene_type:complete
MTGHQPVSVALLIPTLDRSGAEKQLVTLACGLSPDEFQVEVIALTRGGPLESSLAEHGIPLTIIGKRHRIDLAALRRLKRHLARTRPDLLHTWLFAANSYGRLARAASPTTRVIVSERCVDSWKRSWQLWLDRRLIPRTDQFLANSRSVAEFYGSVGIPGTQIEVIANAIDARDTPLATWLSDTPETVDRRKRIREELGLPPDSVLMTCVGRLATQKRVEDLVWAIELLGHHAPAAHLLVVGDGPLRSDLETFAVQTGCRDRVRFTGHRDDVADIWAASDVAWLASDFEGQSNSLMEAMAAGLPVIASNIPANAELVIDGESGHLVAVGDSAGFARHSRGLLDHPERGRSLGQAARTRMLETYSVQAAVDAHARLYHQLASRGVD